MACRILRITKGIFACGLLTLSAGCSHKVYVPVERTIRDTVMQTKVSVDSVLLHDSVFVGNHGDTVVKEIYRWRVRTKTRVDTVYKTKTDSVPVVIAPTADSGPKTKESIIAGFVTWGTRILMLVTVLALWMRDRRRQDTKEK